MNAQQIAALKTILSLTAEAIATRRASEDAADHEMVEEYEQALHRATDAVNELTPSQALSMEQFEAQATTLYRNATPEGRSQMIALLAKRTGWESTDAGTALARQQAIDEVAKSLGCGEKAARMVLEATNWDAKRVIAGMALD